LSILVAFVASITPANARGCFYTGSAGMDLQPDVHALGQWRWQLRTNDHRDPPEWRDSDELVQPKGNQLDDNR
jgi:hypothetical protein